MLIVCPSCGIKYNVPASYLTKDRTLKCAGCGTSWVVKAMEAPAAEVVVPSAPPAAVAQTLESQPAIPQPGESSVAAKAESTEQPVEQAPSVPAVADVPSPAAVSQPVESQPEPQAVVPRQDEPSDAAKEEPIDVQADQHSALPASETHEQPLQFKAPVQSEEQGIPHKQGAEPEEAPPARAAVEDTPAGEVSDESSLTEEHKSLDEAQGEAPTFEIQEAVPPEASAEPQHETFSTLSEMRANEHFSTHITSRQDNSSQADHSSESSYEKPFSFLDLPVEPSSSPSSSFEEAPNESKTVYRSIWDDEPEAPPAQTSGFGTKPEEEPHKWREKDLDEHFSVENRDFAGGAPQAENLVEESDHAERLKSAGTVQSEVAHSENQADVPWMRSEEKETQSVHDESLPAPASQDGAFDDVITRLRAARNNPGAQENHTPPSSPPAQHQADEEISLAEPWVPAWDRVEEDEEPATEHAGESHVSVWHTTDEAEPEDISPSESVAAVEPAEASETPEEETVEVAARHVTPAIDISSRLRSDVLKRVEHADGNRRSFLESPIFWRKAWIASGVGAIILLAACTHWFSALRHLWPALNLL